MDLLARREHGRVELTRKLRQRGAPLSLSMQHSTVWSRKACSLNPVTLKASFLTGHVRAMALFVFEKS